MPSRVRIGGQRRRKSAEALGKHATAQTVIRTTDSDADLVSAARNVSAFSARSEQPTPLDVRGEGYEISSKCGYLGCSPDPIEAELRQSGGCAIGEEGLKVLTRS